MPNDLHKQPRSFLTGDCLWPLGDGRHKLPVREAIRRSIGKDASDMVSISLEERID
jgi:hypothetical protein